MAKSLWIIPVLPLLTAGVLAFTPRNKRRLAPTLALLLCFALSDFLAQLLCSRCTSQHWPKAQDGPIKTLLGSILVPGRTRREIR